jgi:N-acetylmuramoyl-L-alanine amidase
VKSSFHAGNIIPAVYTMGIFLMLFRYLRNAWALRKLAANSKKIDNRSHSIVLLDQDTGPFSFMHWIFVSKADYYGNKIHPSVWCHELTHVKNRHSLDILAVELFLVIFYINPLLWVYRYLIKLNHEYAADENAIHSFQDIESYADQLIRFIHPENTGQFECSFNYVSTKKRIMMLTKTKINKVLFGNKIVIGVALVFATAALLSFNHVADNPSAVDEANQVVVVIDLGHGGNDRGAVSSDGRVKELEIIDAIGAKIKELNLDSRFIFSRDDENISLQDRAKLATEKKAGLLLSIHIASSENEKQSGVEVFYSKANDAAGKSKQIGESFARQLVFRKGSEPNQVKTANFVVLRETECPSVMLTLGFISNADDVNYLKDSRNQTDLAKQIVTIVQKLNL